MPAKIIAIVGSYRKRGITSAVVDAVLNAAAEQGAGTEKIFLTDLHIEYCANCRQCTQPEGIKRGACTRKDDMDALLTKLETADAIVLASPVNFFHVTAAMQCFIERLICFAHWPWGKPGPSLRRKKTGARALIVTSTAMPAPAGRLFTGSVKALKHAAKTLGAEVAGVLFTGMAALRENQDVPERILKRARKAGQDLARSRRRGGGDD